MMDYTIGVFTNLKKAFDTIDYSLLLQKLKRYDIKVIAYSWLSNYLKESKYKKIVLKKRLIR